MATTKVNTEFIAVNAISGTIIADNAITATHIATNAISGTLVQNGGIVTTMIAANNITSTKIVTDAVLTRHIADDQVTAAKLANSINTDIAAKAPLAGPTFTGDVDIDGSDDLRLRFLNGSTFKGGIQVPTSTGDMISGAAVDDLAIRSQGNILFSSGGNSEMVRIQSTGKVGIGTAAAPDTQLHVKNTGGIELRLEADSNNNGQEDCFVRFYTDGKTQEGIAGMDNNNSSTLFSGNTENAMVFGTVSNLPVVFATNNTERMQITNDGKVGIGTFSPAAPLDVVSNSSAVGIDLRGRSADNIGQLTFESNDSGTTYSQLQSLSTELKVKTVANIPMSFHTNNTERMRLDANGKLLIGGNSAHPLSQLVVGSGSYDGGISIYTSTSGTSRLMFADAASGGGQYDGFIAYDHTNQKMVIGTAGSGAADLTIHSGGHIGVEPTARIYLDGISDTYMEEYSANEFGITTGGSRKFALSGGNLYHTGSLNSNHNFSDERLKENIVAIPNAVDKVKTLRGVTFTRKDDGSVGTGLIAQELEKVLPEAVYESKTIDSLENDEAEEYKAINYGNTVGLLVEAIKELSAEVEKLKG